MLRALSWKRKGAEVLVPLHIFRLKFFFFGRLKKKTLICQLARTSKRKQATSKHATDAKNINTMIKVMNISTQNRK